MALVLSRKLHESVVVNGNVTITVVEIERGKIRLSFEAPRDVVIDRKETHDKREHWKDAQPTEADALHQEAARLRCEREGE